MIKVPLNGTPVYKLEFHRRKTKVINRRQPTQSQLLHHIQIAHKRALATDPSAELDLHQVALGVESAFGGKPLYETTATLHIIDAQKDEPAVATGTSRQFKKDDNRRITGREVALGRLLNAKRDGKDILSSVERAAIRKAYDDRAGARKKPKPPTPTGFAPISQVKKAAPAPEGHAVVSKVLNFPAREANRPSIHAAA